MDFGISSERPRWAGALLIALSLAPGARSWAAPFDDPHVGGLTFSGPTSPTLAAVYWNPAALGSMRGSRVMIAGTARLVRTGVDRAPIDPATGRPAAGGMAAG